MDKKVIICIMILIYILGVFTGVLIMKPLQLDALEQKQKVIQERDIYKNLLEE